MEGITFHTREDYERHMTAVRGMLRALVEMTFAHEALYHPKDQHRRANHAKRLDAAKAAIALARASGISEQ